MILSISINLFSRFLNYNLREFKTAVGTVMTPTAANMVEIGNLDNISNSAVSGKKKKSDLQDHHQLFWIVNMPSGGSHHAHQKLNGLDAGLVYGHINICPAKKK